MSAFTQTNTLLKESLTNETKKLQEEFASNENIILNTRTEIDEIAKDASQQYSLQVLTRVLQEYVNKNISILEKVSQLQTTLTRLNKKRAVSPDTVKVEDVLVIENKRSKVQDVLVIDDFEYKPLRFVHDKYNRVIAEYVPDTVIPYTSHLFLDSFKRQQRSYTLSCIIEDLHNEIHAYVTRFTKERLAQLFKSNKAIEITFGQVQHRETNTFPYVYGEYEHRVDVHLDMVFNLTNTWASKEHAAWQEHFNNLGYEMKISHLKIQDQKHASITVYKPNIARKI
jgi:hypothetical protein